MAQDIGDVLRIMRLAIGRRNANDPDSNEATLLGYINDFATLSMPEDVKLFDQWSTLTFDVTEGDDVYPLGDIDGTAATEDTPEILGASRFVNYTMNAYISVKAPVNQSVSWIKLEIFQDAGTFYGYWGINNVDKLTEGFPTQMLYYDNEFIFRTIPDKTYEVQIFAYKRSSEFAANETLVFDYWMRYLAYGAAVNYARDYAFDAGRLAQLERTFKEERNLMMTRAHNQIKLQRAAPRF